MFVFSAGAAKGPAGQQQQQQSAGKHKKKTRAGKKVRQRKAEEERAAAAAASQAGGAVAAAGGVALGLYAEIKAWEKEQGKARKGAAPAPTDPARELRFAIPAERAPCRFWQAGRCAKGADCPYSHSGTPASARVACRFHAKGACRAGAACKFSHEPLGTLPCPELALYHRCPQPPGSCPYQHTPLAEGEGLELRKLLMKLAQDDQQGQQQQQQQAQQQQGQGSQQGTVGVRSQKGAQRVVVRPVPFSSSTSRTRSVQVYAKGKGNKMAPRMPQGQMVRPPVPEVDPDNQEFCIFVRATQGTYQNWIFVSVVKGGGPANAMVKSLESEWGRKLYGRTLISNIGQSVYKDRDAIVKGLKAQIKNAIAQSGGQPQAKIMEPVLNQPNAAFEFAFKIRDQSRPGDFQKTEGLTIIPKESEVMQLPIDKFKAFFSPDNLLGGASSS
ncbi:hypothetical protein OEZ85_008307 [Tetradesmus obliquus]|uniref:C3H1-type domain-containing protein n=1 Tax=Tetradesmus obliquus TaxID=3088 RepID=A0ABY8TIH1_TETOB|nr:hypothetical protein OEZ85_008307 [Tetradesmus obliquus]